MKTGKITAETDDTSKVMHKAVRVTEITLAYQAS